MNYRLLFSFFLVVVFFTTGCIFTKDTASKPGKLNPNITEQLMFALNQEQNAIFQVSYGFKSEWGEVILNQQIGAPHTMNGQSLFVNSAELKRKIAKSLPKCLVDKPVIFVSAKITLKARPSHIEAVVEEVYDVEVTAQACP